MRKQASLSLSFIFISLLPIRPHTLFALSWYKSFSSGNSTAREMKFMNSNAARTFLFLVKRKKADPRDT